jgi:hypothetical protein
MIGPVLDEMFADLNDWSTLDAMFPAQDQMLDEIFRTSPFEEAIGKGRPCRRGGKLGR